MGEKLKVYQALDVAWQKFGVFARESMKALNLPESTREEAEVKLSIDVLAIIEQITEAIKKHYVALQNKDVLYFRLQAGPEYEDLEIPPEMSDKFFLFARVFQSLLDVRPDP